MGAMDSNQYNQHNQQRTATMALLSFAGLHITLFRCEVLDRGPKMVVHEASKLPIDNARLHQEVLS